MHRVDTDGSVAGMFSNGSPPGTLGTSLQAEWMNDTQENLCQTVEGTGTLLVKGLYTQLKDAVIWYVNAGITALKAAVNTWTAQNTFTEGGIFSRTTANSNAVGATGNGTGHGVEATGGSGGGAGLRGTGGGVGPGVIGRSLGAGDGLIGDASSGTGNGIFAAGNATKGPIRTQPQGTPPTNAAIASIYSNTAGQHFAGNGTVWYPIGSGTATQQTNIVGNVATVETNFHIAEIPANRLAATQKVEIVASGDVVGPGATKTLRLYVGGVSVMSWDMGPTSNAQYHVSVVIARTGTNQQRVIVRGSLINPAAESQIEAYSNIANLTATETAAIEVKTTGQDGATPNQIQEQYFSIEYP